MSNEMRKWIDQVKNLGKSQMNEGMGDVKWASDGGYYTKPENNIIVSKKDANFINNTIEEFKQDIQDPETVIRVDKSEKGQINWKIIQDLQKNWGVKFENDNEDIGIDLFWLSPNQNIKDVIDGLEYAWQLFYDKIQK
jgi:hypothetical protein